MSDEEIILDDDFGEAGGDDGDNGDPIDDGDNENEHERSPESLYEDAKDNISLLDDSEVIDMFLNLYAKIKDNPEYTNIKTKSLSHALLLLTQNDDNQKTAEILTEFLELANNNEISSKRFNNRYQAALSHSLHNESTYKTFLEVSTSKMSNNQNMILFLDIKLRQVELMLSTGNEQGAISIIEDAQQYIPIPPNSEDKDMCNVALKLLSIQMEMSLAESDIQKAIGYYDLICQIPNVSKPTLRISGLNKLTEGLQLFKSGKYLSAKDILFESFKDFNNVGNDRRLLVLPYYTLALMMTHERSINTFNNPELHVYKNHPKVAPLAQLYDAYLNSNYLEFLSKEESGKLSFTDSFFIEKLDDVKLFVLKCNVSVLAKPYSRISIESIAKMLKADPNEVKNVVFELIEENPIKPPEEQFNMKYDDVENTIVRSNSFVPDNITASTTQLLSVVEKLADNLLNRSISMITD
ncbi:hypothetical protein TVAG_279420 [Trichomonas vaginalis G3]|uniref:PCI domain-containing protein n=1 Tax=Trichomonas vaginalis (strain ATCC PRA-98 / G3) TaxID=412133 RepID=A2G5Q0_TRIV3|nr:protein deneddylation [Trichomonas vaginalis G3]EAX87522.1 hypothetical protein TVAG_279420 [Trichomonas vaginalis G3]KAI5545664.1 protein deneddylation [Trichomonas vaginalis G3]|eukprot:XP_001300452.1 hypothetical protein [Trichomonas vaginalis G3]